MYLALTETMEGTNLFIYGYIHDLNVCIANLHSIQDIRAKYIQNDEP